MKSNCKRTLEEHIKKMRQLLKERDLLIAHLNYNCAELQRMLNMYEQGRNDESSNASLQ
jgi:hypothetical protein